MMLTAVELYVCLTC